jgi:ABC-2 type transport system ATP-binding protein
VDTYSRGMRQRLGIADTLVKDPDVVILDEPTVAIDPEGVAEVLALIRALARDRGVTVLLASHLLHQVQSVCDRVGIFVAGRMVAQGPMNELAERLAEGPVTVEVGVEGDEAEIERALRSVPGVEQVERDERDTRLWRLRAEGDVRDAVARALVSDGLPLRHLRRSGDELDEIYRRYFQEGEAGDGRVR